LIGEEENLAELRRNGRLEKLGDDSCSVEESQHEAVTYNLSSTAETRQDVTPAESLPSLAGTLRPSDGTGAFRGTQSESAPSPSRPKSDGRKPLALRTNHA